MRSHHDDKNWRVLLVIIIKLFIRHVAYSKTFFYLPPIAKSRVVTAIKKCRTDSSPLGSSEQYNTQYLYQHTINVQLPSNKWCNTRQPSTNGQSSLCTSIERQVTSATIKAFLWVAEIAGFTSQSRATVSSCGDGIFRYKQFKCLYARRRHGVKASVRWLLRNACM